MGPILNDKKEAAEAKVKNNKVSFNGGGSSTKRIIRKPEILGMIQLSDVTLWRMEKEGKFPRRIQLGGNSVGWISTEIDRWLEKKSAERDARVA